VAEWLFCLPPLIWVATGLVAGWLAARQGKSWCWGFALGFFGSAAGVAVAALPRRSRPARAPQEANVLSGPMPRASLPRRDSPAPRVDT
jgi:hypothetical protein